MPCDIGDLRDVVDAINKLCDTMKTGYEERFEDCAQAAEPLPAEVVDEAAVATRVDPDPDWYVTSHEAAVATRVDPDPDWYVTSHVDSDPEEIIFKKIEHYNTETWRRSVSRLELTSSEDVKVDAAERWSDSSVSLPPEVSELAQVNETSEMYYTASSEVSLLSDLESGERGDRGDRGAEEAGERREGAAAGHVAAMRERFESMTRERAASSSPSPDRLG